jgi:nucleotide-binding universal stress UspA family protein
MGAAGNLLLGSITTKVLYFSSTPVLIVNSTGSV